MAERRPIEPLAQAGPIEQVSQRAVLNGCTHGVNPSGRPEKVECLCFSFKNTVTLPEPTTPPN